MSGTTRPEESEEAVEVGLPFDPDGDSVRITASVSAGVVDYYQTRFRGLQFEPGIFLSDRYDDGVMDRIAEEIETIRECRNLSNPELVRKTTRGVHSLSGNPERQRPLKIDNHPQFPVETLSEYGGDAFDTAVLLAGIFERLDIPVRLLRFTDDEIEWAALGVATEPSGSGRFYRDAGKRFYHLETVGERYEFGEIPESIADIDPTVVEFRDAPVPVFDYTLDTEGQHIETTVSVFNVGSAVAEDVTVEVVTIYDDETETHDVTRAVSAVEPDGRQRLTATTTARSDSPVRVLVTVKRDGLLHGADRTSYGRV